MKFLLILLVIYYGLKILSRYLFPIILKKAVSNVQKNRDKQQAQQQQDNTKVGETTVDYKPKTTARSKNVGEYVDFEEVDDNKSKEK